MEEQEVVHSFSKGNDEEVRFSVREYKGRQYMDLRLWFLPAEGGDLRPTKKGITLALEYLPELKKGLEKSAKAASEMALHSEPNPVK